ncbi:MAG: FAD-binding protein [Sinobacteraceae bacterium]|nr:FAD-binding protein [Nevskiaceae bacterium]
MDVDVAVVGSGGGALTAAITAAAGGLEVLLVEKSPYIGGTTALSGGFLWVPGNPLMAAAGKPDRREDAELYIRAVTGDLFRPGLVQAYLDNGPAAIEFLHTRTRVRFQPSSMLDYKPELAGSASGRTITPLPLDGRELGAQIKLVRPPLRFMTMLGGMMLDTIDIYHALNAFKSRVSLLHVAGLTLRYGRDRLFYRRGMRLTLGNALIGRLLCSAFDSGVAIWTSAPAIRLAGATSGITGVTVLHDGKETVVNTRRGVILATGGFAHHSELRSRYLPFAEQMQTMTVPDNSGDSLTMAAPLGAATDARVFQSFLGVPVSVLRHRNGATENYMHSAAMGRAKPGLIAVGPDGRRFGNEAGPYNDFLHNMIAARAVPAWFIFDHAHFRKYGAGWLRPPVWLRRLGPYLENGYLIRAATIESLSSRLGLQLTTLTQTVERYNTMARDGRDLEFGKGDSAFDRSGGEASHTPNPNMGPLECPPFYALRWEPGNLGTFAGLKIDPYARVLRDNDTPIPNLYACGLDAVSVFSGNYPGGGSSIGPAVVFGYIAARHILESATRS